MTPNEHAVIVEMRLAGIPAGYIKWLQDQCDSHTRNHFVAQARLRLHWWESDDATDKIWKEDILHSYGRGESSR